MAEPQRCQPLTAPYTPHGDRRRCGPNPNKFPSPAKQTPTTLNLCKTHTVALNHLKTELANIYASGTVINGFRELHHSPLADLHETARCPQSPREQRPTCYYVSVSDSAGGSSTAPGAPVCRQTDGSQRPQLWAQPTRTKLTHHGQGQKAAGAHFLNY